MKKGLCDNCYECFIKKYEKKETESYIKSCLVNNLHVQNDLIDHFDMPKECNKFKGIAKGLAIESCAEQTYSEYENYEMTYKKGWVEKPDEDIVVMEIVIK